jgi:hypothetical protein
MHDGQYHLDLKKITFAIQQTWRALLALCGGDVFFVMIV